MSRATADDYTAAAAGDCEGPGQEVQNDRGVASSTEDMSAQGAATAAARREAEAGRTENRRGNTNGNTNDGDRDAADPEPRGSATEESSHSDSEDSSEDSNCRESGETPAGHTNMLILGLIGLVLVAAGGVGIGVCICVCLHNATNDAGTIRDKVQDDNKIVEDNNKNDQAKEVKLSLDRGFNINNGNRNANNVNNIAIDEQQGFQHQQRQREQRDNVNQPRVTNVNNVQHQSTLNLSKEEVSELSKLFDTSCETLWADKRVFLRVARLEGNLRGASSSETSLIDRLWLYDKEWEDVSEEHRSALKSLWMTYGSAYFSQRQKLLPQSKMIGEVVKRSVQIVKTKCDVHGQPVISNYCYELLRQFGYRLHKQNFKSQSHKAQGGRLDSPLNLERFQWRLLTDFATVRLLEKVHESWNSDTKLSDREQKTFLDEDWPRAVLGTAVDMMLGGWHHHERPPSAGGFILINVKSESNPDAMGTSRSFLFHKSRTVKQLKEKLKTNLNLEALPDITYYRQVSGDDGAKLGTQVEDGDKELAEVFLESDSDVVAYHTGGIFSSEHDDTILFGRRDGMETHREIWISEFPQNSSGQQVYNPLSFGKGWFLTSPQKYEGDDTDPVAGWGGQTSQDWWGLLGKSFDEILKEKSSEEIWRRET